MENGMAGGDIVPFARHGDLVADRENGEQRERVGSDGRVVMQCNGWALRKRVESTAGGGSEGGGTPKNQVVASSDKVVAGSVDDDVCHCVLPPAGAWVVGGVEGVRTLKRGGDRSVYVGDDGGRGTGGKRAPFSNDGGRGIGGKTAAVGHGCCAADLRVGIVEGVRWPTRHDGDGSGRRAA
ncbi:hypothetical protein E2562_033769 [Oryza meyeriana var. granulata]|uniref:Uncharacterized protein n=1 Tax=Oryza meyeriana var. granulata TaxID=110450 RepID=A0A6G1F192_9ORYZ|nr:hypothetical protein E2562_033769 [Oryza meyeriana var. granulata]